MRGEDGGGFCFVGPAALTRQNSMEVLAITIFLSLCLAGFFVVMFLGSGHRSQHSLEQEALMPLDDEPMTPRVPDPLLSNHDS